MSPLLFIELKTLQNPYEPLNFDFLNFLFFNIYILQDYKNLVQSLF